ncbi:MAG TPA: imidazolonepropionase [Silvibacterium sp.]|nr:imidazolonepropionase [Silvibacterium sp.]
MTAELLITGISQLVTAEGAGPKRGRAMNAVRIVEQAAIAVSGGAIQWAGKRRDWDGDAGSTVDVDGRAVVPGLVDPHTHAVWAGDRLNDFDARISGATYESILAAGGGVRSTIRATAAATREQLVALAEPRVASLIASGATTIEIKSGYGFTPETELMMLEAIRSLAERVPARIVPTLLIHIPPADAAERSDYVTQVCDELIPEVAKRQFAAAVDVFVEKEAWSVAEAELMLRAAKQQGLAVKLHTDQFHSIGGAELGVRMGALSVDHLEAAGVEQIARIGESSVIATIVPGVALHLGIPVAAGRKLIDAGAAVAVGTDLNPGSCPLFSVSAAMALAVRMNGLTAQEALVASTVNAACALGIDDAGRIEEGCRADFLVLESADWRDLAYTMGANAVREVWINGRRVDA